MKKIFCILRTLNYGGAQKALVFVANHLSKCKEYEINIVSLYQSEPTLTVSPNIKIHYGPYTQAEYISSKKISRKIKQIHNAIWLRKILKRNKVSLMIVFLADLVFLSKMASLGLKIPFISSERGTPQLYSKIQKIRYTLGYSLTDCVVFQTRGQQQYFPKSIQRKSCIIENPIIRRTEYQPKNENKKEAIPPIFLAVGRISRTKGFDIAIKATKIIVRKIPNFQLHIYGDGEDYQKIHMLINEEKLQNHVFLMGAQKDVFSLAHKYSGFILSSRNEGFPNVLLEAILEGLPVVAADCQSGGPRAILNDGSSKYLVPVENAEKIAEAVIKIILDPEQALRDAKANKEYCIKKFGEEEIAGKWESLVKKILEKA